MKLRLNRPLPLLVIFLSLAFNKYNDNSNADKTCVVCDRLSLFESIKQKVAAKYWSSFSTKELTPPLVYFDDSVSWLAFSKEVEFKKIAYKKIKCPSGLIIYKFNSRLDLTPFHMENKMTFTDSTSPYYYRPIMFCSNVETASRLVSEVKNTEEWLQMVLHEYFHAFQFNHKNSIRYLADSINVSVDSLHGFYRKNKWFKDYLKAENDNLLKAIDARSIDSTNYYCKQFFEARKGRRKQFIDEFRFDISKAERFWEKIEGTARYVEYNSGFIYSSCQSNIKNQKCDTLFNQFRNYNKNDFLKQPWFYEKTEIMVAYYYVTGFNLCRLMDKLKISYKENLFDRPSIGLEDFMDK